MRLVIPIPADQGRVTRIGKKERQGGGFDVAVTKQHIESPLVSARRPAISINIRQIPPGKIEAAIRTIANRHHFRRRHDSRIFDRRITRNALNPMRAGYEIPSQAQGVHWFGNGHAPAIVAVTVPLIVTVRGWPGIEQRSRWTLPHALIDKIGDGLRIAKASALKLAFPKPGEIAVAGRDC